MDAYASFASSLDQDPTNNSAFPVAAVGGSSSDDLYSSLISKENNVLELIRRVDETKREDALQKSDRLIPLASSFLAGVSGFAARLVHYASNRSGNELVGLLTSPHGMIYAGAIVVFVTFVLMII